MSVERANEIDQALASEDAEQRRIATAAIAELDAALALPLLLRALGDADWRVRKEATIAARPHASSKATLDALVATMGTGDNVGLRNAAVEVLANAGAAAVPSVAAAFSTLDADGRKLAVEALGRSHDPAALPPLERALDDADPNVREAAIEAIAQLGGLRRDRVEAFLLATLDDHDAFVVLTALEGLTALRVTVPWPRLAPLFDDAVIRPAAISAAALSDRPEAASALASALAGSTGSSFAHTLNALGKLAEGPLAKAVGEAIANEGAELAAKIVAATAPGNAREHRAVALKLAALARADAAIARAIDALAEEVLAPEAQEALLTFGAAAAPALLAKLNVNPGGRDEHALDSVSPEIRGAVIEVVALLAARSPSSDLLAALRAAVRDPDVATKALLALARVGTDDDLQIASVQALSESNAIARAAEAALVALAQRHPTRARRDAEAMAEQEAFFFPAAVLLGATGKNAARLRQDMEFLAHAATSGDVNARRAAVEAVAEIDGPSAMEVLSIALADEEHDVAIAAARSLGRLAARAVASGEAAAALRRLLDLIEGTGANDLIAAALRSLGKATAELAATEASSVDTDDLFAMLASFARNGPSPIAVAAIDALGSHLRVRPTATASLAAALDHPEVVVVRAAMLKLGAIPEGRDKLIASLEHEDADVRLLAAEILSGADPEIAAKALARRAAVEANPDVRAALEHALSLCPPPSDPSPPGEAPR